MQYPDLEVSLSVKLTEWKKARLGLIKKCHRGQGDISLFKISMKHAPTYSKKPVSKFFA